MKHAIEEAPVVPCWARPATPLRRQQRSDEFPLRRKVPAAHDCSSRSSLESQVWANGNFVCQQGLIQFGGKSGEYVTFSATMTAFPRKLMNLIFVRPFCVGLYQRPINPQGSTLEGMSPSGQRSFHVLNATPVTVSPEAAYI